MEKSNELSINAFEDIITQFFYFLELDLYYSSKFIEENSNVFIQYFGVEYSNEITRRQIGVRYAKSIDNNRANHSFTVSIIRLPYSGWEDFFSLDRYLRSIGKDIKSVWEGDFDIDTAKKILQQLSDVLKSECEEIIQGDLWLEKFYPRKD